LEDWKAKWLDGWMAGKPPIGEAADLWIAAVGKEIQHSSILPIFQLSQGV
jgi:hypothetical protein